MHNRPKAFWMSFFLTLAVLIPLLGGFVLYRMWQQNMAAPVQKNQMNVPIQTPSRENDQTFFITVAAEQPEFLLLRLNGVDGQIRIAPLPPQSVVLSPSGPVLLQDSYASAGPGRAADLLGQTLNIGIDRYLAITPDSMRVAWNGMEPPRINLTGMLEKTELEELGLGEDPVISLPIDTAYPFLQQLSQKGVAPVRFARIRGAVWDAALRQQLPNLPQNLFTGLRKTSSSLLTDMTVTDMYTMQHTLDWLAKENAEVEAQVPPGRYDTANNRYEFGPDSIAFAKRWFVAQDGREEKEVPPTSAPILPTPKPQEETPPKPTFTPPPASGAPAGALG